MRIPVLVPMDEPDPQEVSEVQDALWFWTSLYEKGAELPDLTNYEPWERKLALSIFEEERGYDDAFERLHPRDRIGRFFRKILGSGNGHEAQGDGAGSGRPGVRFSETTDYGQFLAAVSANARPGFLSEHSEEDLARSRVFLSDDGKAGYMIDPEGDLQNVFRNPGGVKGAGREAVKQAVEHGAVTLDCYDGFLPGLYTKEGFQVVGRMKWVDEFAPADWDYEAYGRPDVLFMSYSPARGTPVRKFADWDEAKSYSRKVATTLEEWGQASTEEGRHLRWAPGEVALEEWTPQQASLHPRDKKGRFRKKIGGGAISLAYRVRKLVDGKKRAAEQAKTVEVVVRRPVSEREKADPSDLGSPWIQPTPKEIERRNKERERTAREVFANDALVQTALSDPAIHAKRVATIDWYEGENKDVTTQVDVRLEVDQPVRLAEH